MLLPQFEQTPIFNAINFNLAIEAPANSTGRLANVNTFLCPSDPSATAYWAVHRDAATGAPVQNICQVAPSNYVGMYGLGEPGPDGNGVFFRDSAIALRDITDGTAQTIVVGERSHRLGEATWVGSVTDAVMFPSDNDNIGRYATETSSGMVLGHAGEGAGPGDPAERRQPVLQLARGPWGELSLRRRARDLSESDDELQDLSGPGHPRRRRSGPGRCLLISGTGSIQGGG